MVDSPEHKRKKKILQNILKSWQLWHAHIETGGSPFLTVDGEDYSFYDILDGLNSLPPRQRQAVFYMTVMDMSELQTAKTMKFKNVNITPVSQYRSLGIDRILDYLDSTPEEQIELCDRVRKYGKPKKSKKTEVK
jgi:DNA-directed RNA polymerase specialized sigma24 family protein